MQARTQYIQRYRNSEKSKAPDTLIFLTRKKKNNNNNKTCCCCCCCEKKYAHKSIIITTFTTFSCSLSVVFSTRQTHRRVSDNTHEFTTRLKTGVKDMCFFPGWCLPFSLWFAPLSFTERRRRRRRRRDIDKEEEGEEEEEQNPSKNSSTGSAFTACTEGRPSEENAFARPMIRKKTTVEMAERKRQLRREKEEENEEGDKGKVGVAPPGITTAIFSTPREEKEGNKEEGEKEEKDNNNNSVVARIESGRSFSYTGEEIVSKERRREEDGEEEEEEEEEGDEGEEGEEDKRSKKEELRSEQILKELRKEGLLDSIQSSTAEYWKQLAAKRKKTKKSFGNS